jgi:hypothetical protein
LYALMPSRPKTRSQSRWAHAQRLRRRTLPAACVRLITRLALCTVENSDSVARSDSAAEPAARQLHGLNESFGAETDHLKHRSVVAVAYGSIACASITDRALY